MSPSGTNSPYFSSDSSDDEHFKENDKSRQHDKARSKSGPKKKKSERASCSQNADLSTLPPTHKRVTSLSKRKS
jgi:hypothetical protein